MRRQVVIITTMGLLSVLIPNAASTHQQTRAQRESPKQTPKPSPKQPPARPIHLPDLVAEVSCTNEEQPNARQILVVVVRNIGSALAGASITKVEFSSGSGQRVFELKTPPLWPGGSHEHKVNIPSGCFDPDCGFSITVDPGNNVRESNEANNRFHENCLG
jgi:subtilase family serine protease